MKIKEVNFSLGQEKHPDRRGYQTPAVGGLLRRELPHPERENFTF